MSQNNQLHLKIHLIYFFVCLLLLLILNARSTTSQTFDAAYFTRTVAPPRRKILGNRSNYLLERMGEKPKMFDLNHSRNGRQFYTNLERFRDLIILARAISLGISLLDYRGTTERNRAQGKMQKIYAADTPFPCPINNTRSPVTPTSVDRLRPGDIDIIAAFGDSLTAGNGALTNVATDMINEYRGLSFAGGGWGNWQQFLTLPNIIKVFNPQLYGYSITNSLVVDRQKSRLNIAEPMLMSHDLPYSAQMFIERLRSDPNVDMQNHWKLLTILIGNNDICSDMCHWDSEDEFLERHAQDLKRTFRLLRENVPKLLINLLPVTNVFITVAKMTNPGVMCDIVHRVGCNCAIGARLNAATRARLYKRIARWHQIDASVAALPEFRTDDFAIIFHPGIMGNTSLPTLPNGETDYRYFAHDCFHFSQLGHASLSNQLWNSMLLPDALKPHSFNYPFTNFVCPSEEFPYFRVPAKQ